MSSNDLITDGVIPVNLSDVLDQPYGATPATGEQGPTSTSPVALSPVISVAELIAQPHPPIAVAAAPTLPCIVCVVCNAVLPEGAASCPACKLCESIADPKHTGAGPRGAPTEPRGAPTGPRPYFDDLLKASIPWITVGGSLLGWSKLRAAKHCLRHFFWEYLMGVELRPSPRVSDDGEVSISALHLGALVHAAIEGFYRTGGTVGVEQVFKAVAEHYPEVVLEARRLVGFYFTVYNATERQQWDMRTVERESRYYYPAKKCGGKRRRLGISSRIDNAYRLLRPGYPRLPPGQASPDGVRLHELKTTATLGWSRLRGFYMDAQLNLQLLTWNHGHATRRVRVDGPGGEPTTATEVLRSSNAELVGTADVVTVTHIGKAKRQDPNKDIDRSHYMIPDDRVMQFAEEIGDWLYDVIGERLFSKWWDRPETWRRDWTCRDWQWQGYVCPYASICQAGEVDETMYQRRPGHGLMPTDIELPKTLGKAHGTQRGGRRKAAADVTGK